MLSILKTNIKIAFFLWVIVLASASAGFAAQNGIAYKGIVSSFQLNMRKTPSQYSDVVIVLEQGARVNVLEKKGVGSWLTVEYKGKKGYIRNRPHYIRLIAVSSKKPDKKPVKKQIKIEKTISKKIEQPEKAKSPEKQKGKAKTDKIVKKNIQEKIQTQKKLVKSFSQKEVEIVEGLNEIDYALNKARLKVAALTSEIIQLEGKIEKLNKDRDVLSKEILKNREYAGKRLRAIYKMNMIGRLEVSGLPGSVFDFFLQQNSMKRIITSDFDILEKQNSDLEQFEILEDQLQKEIKAKTDLETENNEQIRSNKKETLKKEIILKDIRTKKRLSLAVVESLKNAALQLDNRISNLQESEISPLTDNAFSNYKGLLKIPVRGKIISKYGPSRTGDYKSFTFQKGIDIRVERGEPIKSVFKGEVMFAQWLKGYGNLMIIDHGDNYYTLYAHIEEIFRQQGDIVETGEVIATAGDSGSIKGLCLHFEVRHHGKPVNPMQWLKKGA